LSANARCSWDSSNAISAFSMSSKDLPSRSCVCRRRTAAIVPRSSRSFVRRIAATGKSNRCIVWWSNTAVTCLTRRRIFRFSCCVASVSPRCSTRAFRRVSKLSATTSPPPFASPWVISMPAVMTGNVRCATKAMYAASREHPPRAAKHAMQVNVVCPLPGRCQNSLR
jgi:hypothetical protein